MLLKSLNQAYILAMVASLSITMPRQSVSKTVPILQHATSTQMLTSTTVHASILTVVSIQLHVIMMPTHFATTALVLTLVALMMLHVTSIQTQLVTMDLASSLLTVPALVAETSSKICAATASMRTQLLKSHIHIQDHSKTGLFLRG